MCAVASAADSVMVMTKSVAANPSRHRTNALPRQRGSSSSSIDDAALPVRAQRRRRGCRRATRRRASARPGRASRLARARRPRGTRCPAGTRASRSSRRPSGTSPSTMAAECGIAAFSAAWGWTPSKNHACRLRGWGAVMPPSRTCMPMPALERMRGRHRYTRRREDSTTQAPHTAAAAVTRARHRRRDDRQPERGAMALKEKRRGGHDPRATSRQLTRRASVKKPTGLADGLGLGSVLWLVGQFAPGASRHRWVPRSREWRGTRQSQATPRETALSIEGGSEGWAHQDSNLERAGYEPAALTFQLWARQ